MNICNLKNPIWFMRQAGRHLPEYRRIRMRSQNFMDFCFNTNSVVEATLQPIERYDVDCAIIFSDILVIPFILGQEVKFIKNHGPMLKEFSIDELLLLDVKKTKLEKLGKTYTSIKEVRKILNENKSLIGFCGAPWTVLCYMIDGNSSNNFKKTRWNLVENKEEVILLLDKIVNLSINHLEKQYLSGCDTLMVFESWASIVLKDYYNEILYNPINKIVSGLRERQVNAPIIIFPRGIKKNIIDYINNVNADVLSVDFETDIDFVIKNLKKDIILQGNINPSVLREGGQKLINEVDILLKAVKGRNHIFNVGHGILPETPPENVMKVVKYIREKV